MTVFDTIKNFMKKLNKNESKGNNNSKEAAKERLHLVLMQDRANVSADFLELMKQEIIEVIKKYIDVDESAIDVRLTNRENEDGTNGAPALYANIPIVHIKNDAKKAINETKKDTTKTTTEEVVEKDNSKSEKEQDIDSKKEDKSKENKEKNEDKKIEKSEKKENTEKEQKKEQKQTKEKPKD